MIFDLKFSPGAAAQLTSLRADRGQVKRLKAVNKALGYLQTNPRHPSLNTHKYSAMAGPHGAEVFEAYAENRTPAAYRIFWCYGPGEQQITVLAITAHP